MIRAFILAVFFSVKLIQNVAAQGCVAIRGLGAFSCATHHEEVQDPKGWTFTMNNRYFKSYKHFVGKIEQKERVENGSEVINHSFSTDLFLQRHFNQRWSMGINLPIISNARSSLYEHAGNAAGPASRKSTQSFGIGDARFAFYLWMMKPKEK